MPWYKSNTGIILLLILFFPVGLYLMWRYSGWPKSLCTFITACFCVASAIYVSMRPTMPPQSATIAVQPTTNIIAALPTQVPTHALIWTTTHTYSRNGGKKTESFTVGNDWKIQWSCNPGSIGMDAPLFITPYRISDNMPLDSGAMTTCKAGQDTKGETEEHEGGTYYLSINSGIDWSISVLELK